MITLGSHTCALHGGVTIIELQFFLQYIGGYTHMGGVSHIHTCFTKSAPDKLAKFQSTISVDKECSCLLHFRLYVWLCSNEQGSHNHHDAVYVSETDMYSTTTTTTTFLTTLVEKVVRRRENDTAIKSFYVTSCP